MRLVFGRSLLLALAALVAVGLPAACPARIVVIGDVDGGAPQ